MPSFHAADGTELAYHVWGEGTPLVCGPGGRWDSVAHAHWFVSTVTEFLDDTCPQP